MRGLPSQRGPGTYVSLDTPWRPESGKLMQARVNIKKSEILDPNGLLDGTNIEKSRSDFSRVSDIINNMPRAELSRRAGDNFDIPRAVQSVLKDMGYKAEVAYIDAEFPNRGRELVVWDRQNVELAEIGKN